MNESELLPAQTLAVYSPCVAGEMTVSYSGLSSLSYSKLISPDDKSGDCFNPKQDRCSSHLKEHSSTSPLVGLAVFNI